jgi:Zn-dependent oligopeptidase
VELYAWDIAYFSNQIKKEQNDPNAAKIREYFPWETFRNGMFKIFSTILNINIVEIKNAKVWSPEVKMYEVRDKSSTATLGYFYLDVFPRAGKHNHGSTVPVYRGRILPDGSYQKPVAVLFDNVAPRLNEKVPSLLAMREVENILHEFGHTMHEILTQAPYSSLAGAAVDQDFVETPSQMLENWVWTVETLQLLSGHYQTGEKIPAEIAQKLIDGRAFNLGQRYLWQVALSLTDLAMHTTETNTDVSELYKRIHTEVMTYAPESRFMATFAQSGYGYYKYTWSEVYSADLFSRFQEEGMLNEKLGRHYRSTILAPGAMKNPFELLRDFLGRDPTSDAFVRKIGL